MSFRLNTKDPLCESQRGQLVAACRMGQVPARPRPSLPFRGICWAPPWMDLKLLWRQIRQWMNNLVLRALSGGQGPVRGTQQTARPVEAGHMACPALARQPRLPGSGVSQPSPPPPGHWLGPCQSPTPQLETKLHQWAMGTGLERAHKSSGSCRCRVGL